LRYFFVSYIKILRFYKKNFLIGPLLREVRFFRGTGLRQRGNVESQRAAEAKAACDTALVASNRERRQEQLRAAQELVDCLGAGMDLLSVEQIKQIKEAAAAAGSKPGEALRSFGERLRDLRKENPHASEACHEIFSSWFFRESSSPEPLIIAIGSFQIFAKFT
jgi:hypothetical protein